MSHSTIDRRITYVVAPSIVILLPQLVFAGIIAVGIGTTIPPAQPPAGLGGVVAGFVTATNTAAAAAAVGPLTAVFEEDDVFFDDPIVKWLALAVPAVPPGGVVRWNLLPVIVPAGFTGPLSLGSVPPSVSLPLLDEVGEGGVLEFEFDVTVGADPSFPVDLMDDAVFDTFVAGFPAADDITVFDVTGIIAPEPATIFLGVIALLGLVALRPASLRMCSSAFRRLS